MRTKKSGLQIGFFLHFVGNTEHMYVALGVSIDGPSAIHITATMTLLPAETCSELVERNNARLIDVTETLARNFIHET
jgi:hypothetical protein